MRGGGGRGRGGRGRGRGGGKVANFENPFSQQQYETGRIKPEFSATHSDRPQPIFPTAVLRRFRVDAAEDATAAQERLDDRQWWDDNSATSVILDSRTLLTEVDKELVVKTAVGQSRKRQGYTNNRLTEHCEFAARSSLLPAVVVLEPAKRGRKSSRPGRPSLSAAAAQAGKPQRRGRLPSMDSLNALEKRGEGGEEEDEENEDGEAAPPVEEELDEDEDDEDNDYVVDHYRDDDEEDKGGDEDGGGGGGDYS